MNPVPKPAHDAAPSHDGLPLAKPPRRERVRKGGITMRKERVEATEEKRFGPYADLIRACPCAARYPQFYASRDAVKLTLSEAAQDILHAKAMERALPRLSVAHHAVGRGRGGLACHLVPVDRFLHDESHLHGNPNAFLATRGLPNARALADLLWSVKEEIRVEAERVERGGGV